MNDDRFAWTDWSQLKPVLRARRRAAGGSGSGNFGHAGRPGQIGGSGSGEYTGADREIVRLYAGSVDPPEGLYVSDGLNGLLRGFSRYSNAPENYSPEQRDYYTKQVDQLQSIIEKTPTVHDQVFYRGVDGRLADKLKDGTEFVDRGFTSITSDRKIAEERFTGFEFAGQQKGRVFDVHVPKGTPLMDVDRLLNPANDREYTTEHEHLLGHGTRFKVRGDALEVVR